MGKTLEDLKLNKYFMNLTGQTYGDMKVLSFVEKRGKHPMWDIECNLCKRLLVTSSSHIKNKIKGMGCGVGCSCRINKVEHLEGDVTRVDVSTKTFPDKHCLVDTTMYHKYMTKNKWYAYKSKHSKNYYVYAKINNKRIALHRLIRDVPPELVTDHVNGNGLDNRIINLRAVSHEVNMKNVAKQENTASGHTGVTLRLNGNYQVSITIKGKCKTVGTFSDLDQAIEERTRQERLNGYHENHGRLREEQ